jgi:hypothetical protein
MVDKLTALAQGLWNIFSCINGNPSLHNIGMKLTIMLFFSMFLMVILQIRTKITFDKKHIVAFIGAVILFVKVMTLFVFEWTWQIGLYDDWLLHFLYPPLEHFWNMLFLGCMAYYTLHIYDYYPGLLKKILWYIPITIITFFIYSTVQWKDYFLSHLPAVSQYELCMSDWQNHLIIAVIALYIFVIAIVKYRKYNCYLSAFWTVIFIEHASRFYLSYNLYQTDITETLLNSLETWALPLLILHFINAYVNRDYLVVKDRRRRVVEDSAFIPCDDCTNTNP